MLVFDQFWFSRNFTFRTFLVLFLKRLGNFYFYFLLYFDFRHVRVGLIIFVSLLF